MKPLKAFLLLITISICLLTANMQAQNKPKDAAKTTKSDTIFKRVEVQPVFKGGVGALYKFINSNIKYPEEAKKEGIQGKVIVKFVISSKGKVSNVTVFRGVNKLLDEEAVRVVSMLPDWEPGKSGGKAVASYAMLPVHFKLK